tara:strand:+ start:527 stop:1024 length:498 start_codon:yes stop_codon:yes gene_type:complete
MVPAGMRCIVLLTVVLFLAQGTLSAFAQTGLPLPRFASLRASKVHLRTGPGVRYPVEWVYQFRNMPVEILAEFDNWRKIRDWQGSEGWVHRTMLAGKRTALVVGGIQPLRRDPSPDSPLVARAEENVLMDVLECGGDWCRVEAVKTRGWMQRSHFWGVYPTETLN